MDEDAAAQTRAGRYSRAHHTPSRGVCQAPCFPLWISLSLQSVLDHNSSSSATSVTENNSEAQDGKRSQVTFLLETQFHFPTALLLVYRLVNLNLRTEAMQ